MTNSPQSCSGPLSTPARESQHQVPSPNPQGRIMQDPVGLCSPGLTSSRDKEGTYFTSRGAHFTVRLVKRLESTSWEIGLEQLGEGQLSWEGKPEVPLWMPCVCAQDQEGPWSIHCHPSLAARVSNNVICKCKLRSWNVCSFPLDSVNWAPSWIKATVLPLHVASERLNRLQCELCRHPFLEVLVSEASDLNYIYQSSNWH